jgi:hypothetical protein
MPPLGNELALTLQIKNLVSKGFSPFFYAIQAQNLSLLLVLTQCPFSCLCGPITYWKQLEKKQEMKASRFIKWNNFSMECPLDAQTYTKRCLPILRQIDRYYWKQLENKQEMKHSRFMKWNNRIN